MLVLFFKDESFFELHEFYNKQAYKIIYPHFQIKEKNIYLFMHLQNMRLEIDY